ncbi:hypothetical protein BIV24_17055 [Streptomyces colonosanans]|uniref:Uncharacterized protein n=1 Tax=Streptomyces colonosanans TaxID=1428652 RepID=A0A1S2PBB9_9ACTN|nr:hypothetical protein BIV24_17055 [Streptomyces colonosanans]
MLEEEWLLDEIEGARRGGFCCEPAGAFGALPRALGPDMELDRVPRVRKAERKSPIGGTPVTHA